MCCAEFFSIFFFLSYEQTVETNGGNKQWKQTVEHQQERGFVSLHALI